ncbi:MULTISPECIES: transposase [Lactobacillales]|jgi:transposase|uniref:Transposase n=8 Tax=Lactobacillaceae TaxID=33958 RepID=A0A192H3E0_9LACO|nr:MULTISPECIES: transposase [Lactobacillaceae]KJU73450.1 transposase [Pediococcus damnosus LMG 28219]AMV63819.1 Mobile element protein [Pediococcus damnosus]AMV69233.1 Mobile element protein [Pediococcus damnosus]ANK61249.1 transposase [Loigolactobacillus backii]ANK61480.1 transposase [Loigolactobacillus backii]
MTKKKYSVDFRKMIVKLYQDGAPVADLTDEYGVSNVTIYKWINLYKEDKGSGISKSDVLALQKRLKQLESENDILKKALTIFAKK